MSDIKPAMRNLGLILVLLIAHFAARTMPVEAASSSKSSLDTEALDAYITGQMSKHGIQGAALALTSGTEIVYLKGYGTAGQGHPMTPQTPMYIGSVSKSFTGLAIAQLIDRGKIGPNEPVQSIR